MAVAPTAVCVVSPGTQTMLTMGALSSRAWTRALVASWSAKFALVGSLRTVPGEPGLVNVSVWGRAGGVVNAGTVIGRCTCGGVVAGSRKVMYSESLSMTVGAKRGAVGSMDTFMNDSSRLLLPS